MKLLKLTIENFKGLSSFEFIPDGHDSEITGANGTGKTTVFDAFLWLFYGKDSTGRKDFGVQPLDSENNRIPHLVTKVEADIEAGGHMRNIRKELHENRVKDELRGFTTKCWINDVPKKVGEYTDAIDEIIGEDTFKLLTDPHYFNNLHWSARRTILMDLAKGIGDPDGFEELLGELEGRSIDDYKKVLADQKKRLKEEADEITPRIDEISRGMVKVEKGLDIDGLKNQRVELKQTLDGLAAERKKVTDSEKERQRKIDDLNKLKADKIKREAQLESSTAGITDLLATKAEVFKSVQIKKDALADADAALKAIERVIGNDRAEMDCSMRQLEKVRKEYKEAKDAPVDGTCNKCGQKYPPGKTAEIEAGRTKELEGIKKRGDEINKDIAIAKKAAESGEETRKAQHQTLARLEQEMEVLQGKADKKLASIQKKIDGEEKPKIEEDAIWLAICNDIAKTEKSIGEPVTDLLETLDTHRKGVEDQISNLTIALANYDRIKQDAKRIKELEAKEKELAQRLADLEKSLQQIDDYKFQQSQMIEAAVNDKFEHVTFRLFKYLINGSTEEACDATYGGVPYDDCSYGQRILMGVDIINTLAESMGAYPPLWLDNSESLTYDIKYAGQTIRMSADAKTTKLTYKTK